MQMKYLKNDYKHQEILKTVEQQVNADLMKLSNFDLTIFHYLELENQFDSFNITVHPNKIVAKSKLYYPVKVTELQYNSPYINHISAIANAKSYNNNSWISNTIQQSMQSKNQQTFDTTVKIKYEYIFDTDGVFMGYSVFENLNEMIHQVVLGKHKVFVDAEWYKYEDFRAVAFQKTLVQDEAFSLLFVCDIISTLRGDLCI